jgi:hypothetical protein
MTIENFRTINFPLSGQTFLVAGMAHPIYSPNLELSLQELKDKGFDAIVSLEEENREILADYCEKLNIDNYSIIVNDFTAPTLDNVNELIKIITDSKLDNKNIAIHCKGGNGRTGTMLASLQIFSIIEDYFTTHDNSQDFSHIIDTQLKYKIDVYDGEVECSELVHDIIMLLRSQNQGNYSVECEEQVNFLNNLHHTFITANESSIKLIDSIESINPIEPIKPSKPLTHVFSKLASKQQSQTDSPEENSSIDFRLK